MEGWLSSRKVLRPRMKSSFWTDCMAIRLDLKKVESGEDRWGELTVFRLARLWMTFAISVNVR